jgi:hypothetical protein
MTNEEIKYEVALVRCSYEDELKQSYPARWQSNQRTMDIYSIGRWVSDRYKGKVSEDRRRELLWYFNRIVRAESNPFDAAALTILIGDSGQELAPYYKTFFRERKGS